MKIWVFIACVACHHTVLVQPSTYSFHFSLMSINIECPKFKKSKFFYTQLGEQRRAGFRFGGDRYLVYIPKTTSIHENWKWQWSIENMLQMCLFMVTNHDTQTVEPKVNIFLTSLASYSASSLRESMCKDVAAQCSKCFMFHISLMTETIQRYINITKTKYVRTT